MVYSRFGEVSWRMRIVSIIAWACGIVVGLTFFISIGIMYYRALQAGPDGEPVPLPLFNNYTAGDVDPTA